MQSSTSHTTVNGINLDDHIKAAKAAHATTEAAKKILHCLDLTSLNDDDTPQRIDDLIQKADQGGHGQVAALCVYPRFLEQVFNAVSKTDIGRATVINFPGGQGTTMQTDQNIRSAIDKGADEIDIVLDYRSLQEGDEETARRLLTTARDASGEKAKLKVILETSAFDDPQDIYDAARLAIECGADFIKTSTGKHEKGGATLEAAAVMMQAIADTGKITGIKISGGVKTVQDGAQYIALAKDMLGADFVDKSRFRIGASGVMTDIQKVLGIASQSAAPPTSSY